MSVISRNGFSLQTSALRADGMVAARVQAVPVVSQPLDSEQAFAMALLRNGTLSPHAMVTALAQVKTGGGRLIDVLLAHKMVPEDRLYHALHAYTGIGLADLRRTPADPRLIDRLGPGFCVAHKILPWRNSGGATIIATAYADTFQQHYAKLVETFGPVANALAPPDRIEAAILSARGPHLAKGAETLLPLIHSCRNFRAAGMLTWAMLALLAVVALAAYQVTLTVALLWVSLTLLASAFMKLSALISTFRQPATEPDNPATLARLPVVSIMVGLYKESDIAARLVRRLGRLDYPRDKLDILLIVEEDDHLTRNALRRAGLPGWMRVVVTPRGKVKTKPRALNYGLSQCRGSIVGVYDAEDAPEGDQIRKVVDRFANRGPQVACLQGVLDFYNPRRNWLSRCFTVEYASWFRVILPGLERLGLPIPLGGTTLFFRRDVLEALGGWDAHNVTEDADLGMRLVRAGYRTELIATTTFEEANCVALPWVKQRSRWVKGYMMTYITHMRNPGALWRDLGPRGFVGFQVLFAGSLTQALLAPLLWSMLSLHLGFGHPTTAFLPPMAITALTVLFILAELLNMLIGFVGLSRSGQKITWAVVPSLTLYFPLQALAAYKALWELLRVPFYWDKTSHGALSSAKV